MAALTDTHENTLLNHMFGAASYTNPATWYLGLLKSDPGETGTITSEVTGGAYARKAITNNVTNFPTTTSGEKNLGISLAFDEATSGWGTVTHVGLFAVSTGGPLLMYAPLDSAQIINSGDIFRIAAGTAGLRITLA